MSGRTLTAIIVGILLGGYAGYSVAHGGYAAFFVLLIWILINTFVVCRIAEEKIVLLGMIPNVVTAVVVNLISLSDYNGPAKIPATQILTDFIFFIALNVLLSLAVSVPIYLLRSYLLKRQIRLRRRGLVEAKWLIPPPSSK